jgi:hypothetical protein
LGLNDILPNASIVRRLASAAAIGAAIIPLTAHSVTLTPYNTDSLTLGDLLVPPGMLVDNFQNLSGSIGLLGSTVYFDSANSVYTYTFAVAPSVNSISEVNTAFAAIGLTNDGTQVGFSFSDALASGGSGTSADFTIIQDPDGTLDYQTNGDWFGSFDSINFHFRSTLPPTTGYYNAINTQVGTALGYAPVSVPAAVWLFGSGLLGMIGIARRKKAA